VYASVRVRAQLGKLRVYITRPVTLFSNLAMPGRVRDSIGAREHDTSDSDTGSAARARGRLINGDYDRPGNSGFPHPDWRQLTRAIVTQSMCADRAPVFPSFLSCAPAARRLARPESRQ